MVCNTGTESTMLAWRLMRAATGRTKIAKFEGCYHGWHDYAQWSVDADPDKWGPAERPHMVAQTSGIPDAVRDTVMVLPFNDSAFDLIEENAGELAGVAIEPIVGGGMLPVDTKFLERLREVTRRHGILLHFDEVITGFRVALGGSQELTGVIPDVATYGKIIGGGTPIGAVACSKALVATAQKSDDGLSLAGTFSGNPLTLAAGTATIRHLQENPGIYDELATRGEGLRNGFNDWAANRGYPFRISGFGSLFQIHNLQVIPSVPRDLAGQDEEVLEDLQLHIRLNDVLHPWFHLAFFSAAHNQKDLDEMLQAFKVSVKGVMEMESP